jgi:carbonic anhydrase/acetyltransferase-like protein (isoleucine patch superfamily)
MNKFEMTSNTKAIPGIGIVRQIRALVDIHAHNVKKGDLGGWLRFPSNLSQSGDSWVADDAVIGGAESMVAQNALVCDSALVKDSYIGGDTIISGKARVVGCNLEGTGNLIGENATLKKVDIHGKAITINGHAHVERLEITIQAFHISIGENARVQNTKKHLVIAGHTIRIEGNAHLENCLYLFGSMIKLSNDCVLKDGVQLNGKRIKISGASSIEGNIEVGDNVELLDCVRVYNNLTSTLKLDNTRLNGDIVGTPNEFQAS